MHESFAFMFRSCRSDSVCSGQSIFFSPPLFYAFLKSNQRVAFAFSARQSGWYLIVPIPKEYWINCLNVCPCVCLSRPICLSVRLCLQSKALIPLQTEAHPETKQKVLTNYMFPQQPRHDEGTNRVSLCESHSEGCKVSRVKRENLLNSWNPANWYDSNSYLVLSAVCVCVSRLPIGQWQL